MECLSRAVVAVTRTKRRRFLWCAWWTGDPCATPFRPPDAWKGGARTKNEAVEEATRVAGVSLTLIEGRWAGAWLRTRDGLPPFPDKAAPTPSSSPRPVDPHTVLGVPTGASLAVLKAAFRALAQVHHPDRRGGAEAFIALKRAYDTLALRRARRGRT
jgi:hypothetical protein